MRFVVPAALSLLAICSAATAQVVHGPLLLPLYGDGGGDRFGWSVSGVGDVNGDGFDDFIVGASDDDDNGGNSGSARVFSGMDGSVLYTFNGDSSSDEFGFSVSGAGDVNGDGFDDFIVGALFDDNNGSGSGSARVFSGADGSILYTFNGDSAGDQFGFDVSGAGDVNGDGFDDLIVGAHLDDNNGGNSGSARVFSGVDGSILYTFNGDSSDDRFGVSVSGAGDVNGDGFDDIVVGANRDDNNGSNSGSARVFSGVDGSTLYTFNGESALHEFGRSVSGAGDVNGDGFDDIIVGAPLDNSNGFATGSARVFSGADGAVLHTYSGNTWNIFFGWSVSDAGDINADGFDDFIVGVFRDDDNGLDSGSARVFSGVDGSVLYTFNGEAAGHQFGTSVSGAGDLNGDGFDDLIIGTREGSGLESGSVYIIVSAAIPDGAQPCPGDATGDGLVDLGDLNSVLSTFGDSCPPETNDDLGAFIEQYPFNGDSTNDSFGWSVSGAGDVNGDGVEDFIVGAYRDDNTGVDSGSARVFSSVDGSVLYTFNGDSAGDRFGISVSGAGDVNGDGFDDLIVGAPFDDNNGSGSGSARVFSGADGSVFFTFDGDAADDQFGWSVSGAGDVNGDGFDDFIVGAPFGSDNGIVSGSARVFSGNDGSILYTFYGDSVEDAFGYSVSGAGDVNGDGFDDLIVGAYFESTNGTASGSARVLSGADGSILYTFYGDSAGGWFGFSVSGAGDVDGDGFDDFIVGAPFDDNSAINSGSARVFSGADGSVLYTFYGDSAGGWFGRSVSSLGDVNGDGFDDLVVGASLDDTAGTSAGAVRVFSGADGSVLFTAYGSPNDNFGFSVARIGDLNGDGFGELIAGVPGSDFNGSNSGSVRLLVSAAVEVTTTCPPDTNKDGEVNLTDLNAILSAFGTACP